MALALRMPMEIQTHFAGCWIQRPEDFDLDELKISCSVYQEKKNILKTAKQRMFLLLLLLLSQHSSEVEKLERKVFLLIWERYFFPSTCFLKDSMHSKSLAGNKSNLKIALRNLGPGNLVSIAPCYRCKGQSLNKKNL